MIKSFLFMSLAAVGFAGQITMNYTGTPCITSENGYGTGIGGIGTNTVFASALADYLVPGIIGPPPSSCLVTASVDLMAGSLIGPGFLTVSLFGDGEGAGAQFSLSGAGLDVVGGCGESGCILVGGSHTIPFTLGEPFELTVEASARAYNVGCCNGASLIQVSIQAYELVDCPGNSSTSCLFPESQTITDPGTATATPEPATLWLAVLGFAFQGLRRFLAVVNRA